MNWRSGGTWLVVSAALFLAACAAPAPAARADALKLRLGLTTTPAPPLPNAVLWLAKDAGFYQAEGLDVDLQEVQATPSVVTAMRTGDVDVGSIATQDALSLTAGDSLQLRAIGAQEAQTHFLVVARDGINSVGDLKGKSFGIARPGSVDDTLSRLVLSAQGVDPSSLTWVGVGAPNLRIQAILAGQLDATTTSVGTWVTIQNQKGIHLLVDEQTYFAAAPIVQKVTVVTAQILQRKSEALRRFTTALIKASRYFASDKQKWVDAMHARRPDVTAADLAAVWEQTRTSWPVNGGMSPDQYQKTADFLYATDDFKALPKVSLAAWAETSLVDGVLKQIGVDASMDPPGRDI
jgi:NitT/TauT family transport system substrate-binding protein